MKNYVLKTAQGGLSAGRAFLIDAKATDVGMKTADMAANALDREEELLLYEKTVEKLEKELSEAAEKADKDSADIFEMEKILLRDEGFYDKTVDLIKEAGMSAATAAGKAGNALAEKLSNSNEYNSQRSEDLRGLTCRLVGMISGEEEAVPVSPSIIVADELSPARLSAIDPELILGIITDKGAPTSHVSILAGNIGVPYFYGSEEALEAIENGMELILDEGKLTIGPDEEMYREAVERMEAERSAKEARVKSLQSEERRTKVYANIKGPEDIDELIMSGAEGVGLFRSEFLFLGDDKAPSEDEQFEAYRSVCEAMNGKETVIRTMDLGSDKKATWLDMPDEKNPALGCRGLRLSLREDGLFRTQLRALIRAAVFGNVRIMIPMVASEWEIDAVRAEIRECAGELEAENVEYRIPDLGIMIETPAAAMIADRLAEKVDFFSIGTNDLTQYTLALDREAQGLDDYYDPYHESIMRLIGMTASAGHEKNVPTAICGELASDPAAIPELIKRGVDELSVSMPKVAETKANVVEAEKGHAEAEEKKASEAGRVVSLVAPVDGKLVAMENIPDPAFSSGALGNCSGIIPESGSIYAPCDGTVSGISETKHAVSFISADGRKILIHVGIDTVKLAGEGFALHVKEGDQVSAGDPVMEADIDLIREAGLDPIVIIACGS